MTRVGGTNRDHDQTKAQLLQVFNTPEQSLHFLYREPGSLADSMQPWLGNNVIISELHVVSALAPLLVLNSAGHG